MVNFMRLLGYDFIYIHKINSNTFNFVHGFLFVFIVLLVWFGDFCVCVFLYIIFNKFFIQIMFTALP